MAAKVFQRDEHEFLRIAAMAEPSWERLRQLVQDGFDWQYLRETALLHQLDGVVACRLGDDRLDGIVPTIVRDDCRRYPDHLAGYNRSYWEQVAAFVAAMDRTGVPYVVASGPMQYLPLGLDCWPRCWADLDIAVRVDDADDVRDIARQIGAADLQSEADEPTFQAELAAGLRSLPNEQIWEVRMPDGLEVTFDTGLPGQEGETDYRWDLCDGAERATVLGVDMPVPHPTTHVVHAAYVTWCAVIGHATRLPLWAQARIKCWSDDPRFAWDGVMELLSQEEKHRATEHHPALCAAWSLRFAARVYGIGLPAEILALPEPTMILRGSAWKEEHVVEWEARPDDEDMLFESPPENGVASRKRAGIWRSVNVDA